MPNRVVHVVNLYSVLSTKDAKQFLLDMLGDEGVLVFDTIHTGPIEEWTSILGRDDELRKHVSIQSSIPVSLFRLARLVFSIRSSTTLYFDSLYSLSALVLYLIGHYRGSKMVFIMATLPYQLKFL